jgi:hypothetical protein
MNQFIARYRKTPRGAEGILKSELMRHYGITLGQYYTMLGEQNGLCRICKRLCSTGFRLAVDHIHVDGYEDLPSDEKARLVRGLLCAGCNRSLGAFQDDPDILREAAKYLENAEARIIPAQDGTS